MRFEAVERANETLRSNFSEKRSMPDPNLPMLEDAMRKLAPFLGEIVFVGGVTYAHLIPGADVSFVDLLDQKPAKKRAATQQNATLAQLKIVTRAGNAA